MFTVTTIGTCLWITVVNKDAHDAHSENLSDFILHRFARLLKNITNWLIALLRLLSV